MIKLLYLFLVVATCNAPGKDPYTIHCKVVNIHQMKDGRKMVTLYYQHRRYQYPVKLLPDSVVEGKIINIEVFKIVKNN